MFFSITLQYYCLYCGQIYDDDDDDDDLIDSNQYPHQCAICKCQYPSQESFSRHQRLFHNVTPVRTDEGAQQTEPNQYPRKCPVCKHPCLSQQSFSQHLKFHNMIPVRMGEGAQQTEPLPQLTRKKKVDERYHLDHRHTPAAKPSKDVDIPNKIGVIYCHIHVF